MATATPRFSAAAFRAAAHGPRHFGVELFELQALFLQRDFFEILINGHEISQWKICKLNRFRFRG